MLHGLVRFNLQIDAIALLLQGSSFRDAPSTLLMFVSLQYLFPHSSLSVCSGLPEDWRGVNTKAEFPVDHGITVTVSCHAGYVITGSNEVTCNTYFYQDFEYQTKPECVLGEFSSSYIRITNMTRTVSMLFPSSSIH